MTRGGPYRLVLLVPSAPRRWCLSIGHPGFRRRRWHPDYARSVEPWQLSCVCWEVGCVEKREGIKCIQNDKNCSKCNLNCKATDRTTEILVFHALINSLFTILCSSIHSSSPMAFLPNKLNPQGQRLLTIIIAVPVFVSTSYILYKRLVLEQGPPPRPVPRSQANSNDLLSQYQLEIEREEQEQQQQKGQSEKSV